MNNILLAWYKKYFSDPEAFSILAIIFVALLTFNTVGPILVSILVSVVLTYILAPVVRMLERLRCPHILAVISVFILFLGLAALILLLLLPLLWQQLVSLFSNLPSIIGQGQKLILNLHAAYPKFVSLEQMNKLISGISGQLLDLGRLAVSFSRASIAGIITVTIYTVLVPILVFFFLKDQQILLRWLEKFLPRKRVILQQISVELNEKIGRYVKGKVVEILIVALISAIAFSIIELNYAILLGALVGVSVVIPYVGIIVVTIPIVIIGLVQWGLNAHFLYLMIIYAAIIILDANVLVPLLFAEVMNLHPVAIMLGVLVFGSIGGFWGIFFAIPLVTLVHVLYKSWPRTG